MLLRLGLRALCGLVVSSCGGPEFSESRAQGNASAQGSAEPVGTVVDSVPGAVEPGLPAAEVSPNPGIEPASSAEPAPTMPGLEPEAVEPIEPIEPIEVTSPEPSSDALDVAPGPPTQLAGELVHPTRIAFDGGDVLVLHHPSYVEDSTAADEILRVPRAGGPATVVVSAPSMTGFVVDGDRIWVNTADSPGVLELDKATGAERSRIDFTADPELTNSTYQLAQNGTHVFAALAYYERIEGIEKSSGTAQTLFSDKTDFGVPPQWLLADEQAVYFLRRLDVTSAATLVRVAADGSGLSEIGTLGPAIALGAAGEELVAIDYEQGDVVAFSKNGTQRALGTVVDAWGVAADESSVYVSTQPATSCEEGYSGQVVKVPLVGGETTVLSDGLACPSMLLVGDDGLYWVNNGYSMTNELGVYVSTPTGSLVKLGG